MSKRYLEEYYNEVDNLIRHASKPREEIIRVAFGNLLNKFSKDKHLVLIAEEYVEGTRGRKVKPDGVLKNSLRLVVGLWESKDEFDDLEKEIDFKKHKGYPFWNILFEDGQTAILYQNNQLIGPPTSIRKPDQIYQLIQTFIGYENPIIKEYNKAIEVFKRDMPTILTTIRDSIVKASTTHHEFIKAFKKFHDLCKNVIHPDITAEDIHEMLIQHLLTSDIFNKIFGEPEFHRQNNIAKELELLLDQLYDHSERRNLLGKLVK